MKKITTQATKVAACIGLMLASSGAYATDWDVTQSANIEAAAPTITQGGTALVSGSNQAVNGIVLDNTEDDLASGSQSVTVTSTGVVLTQGDTVDNANQALNFIDADNIGSDSAVSQTVSQTTGMTTVLTQSDDNTTGGNVQGINYAKTRLDVDALTQSYTEQGNLQMRQNSVDSANNIQGVNIVLAGRDAGTVSLTQSVSVTGRTSMRQGANNIGGSNTQVGNAAIAVLGDVTNTTQSFSSSTGDLVLRQVVGGSDNVQATNLLRTESAAGDIDSENVQTTTKTGGNVLFTQDTGSANNIQAGNVAISGDNIEDLVQTFNASTAASVDFDQTPTAINNIQAGNMAVLENAGNDTIGDVSQTFTSSITRTDLLQSSGSTNLIQAGNLIDINSGDVVNDGATTTTQLFEALGGDVTLTQNGGGSANLQAFNAIVDAAGAGSGGTVSQQLSINSTTFVMAQDSVSGSGQYGNFVGVKY